MELENLVGLRKLTGLDKSYKTIYGGACNSYIFQLDGVNYEITENPDDGYRSYMEDIKITDKVIKNEFKPCKVYCKMRTEFDSDVLDMIDLETNLIVLSIGTENTNDYYPCCIMQWNPQNMKSNSYTNERR